MKIQLIPKTVKSQRAVQIILQTRPSKDTFYAIEFH